MRQIVIDARTVVEGASSGIGNYVVALVRHMVPLADDLRFTLLRHPRGGAPILEHPRVREVVVPGETKSLRTVLGMRLGRRLSRADLYHAPAEMLPPGLRCPVVVTLHDLMWVEARALASAFPPVRWALGQVYTAAIRHAVSRARAVIAISRASARALERCFPGRARAVHVVHHGVDSDRYDPGRAGPRADLDPWVPAGCRFSLAVGQGSPYKNHPNIIRAFLRATEDRPDHRLVLVRRFARVDREMRALLGRPDVRRRIIFHPHLPDDVLLTLYRHARMLLFVSRYEGFGMPALEAMALGVPVLASHAPAVVEVTADAALRAEATDIDDIAAAIRRLDTDEPLRRRLVEAGRRRAADLTWERCARQTLDVYRSVLDDGRCARSGSIRNASASRAAPGALPHGRQRSEQEHAGRS